MRINEVAGLFEKSDCSYNARNEAGKNNISFSDTEYYFSIIQLTGEVYRSTVRTVAPAFFPISRGVYILPFRFAALTLATARAIARSALAFAKRRLGVFRGRSGPVRFVGGCRRAR